MQEYTKIKVASKDDGKRFYRIVAIKGDPDLYTLGAYLGETIGAWFEHMYLFRAGKARYVADSWLEDDLGIVKEYSLGKCHLSDLGNKFVYEYDTGEGWCFDCSVYKNKYVLEDDEYEEDDYPDCLVIEGKGQGIFENDHGSLWRYLNGEIDPESSEEIEDKCQYLPMNLDFEKYGDFDSELDLEDLVFYKEDVAEVVDEMKGIVNDNYSDVAIEDDDEIEDYDENDASAEDFAEMKVARDIFLNDGINKVYRSLIKKYDMDEVYEKLLFCFLNTIEETDETNVDVNEIEERYLRNAKAIK